MRSNHEFKDNMCLVSGIGTAFWRRTFFADTSVVLWHSQIL